MFNTYNSASGVMGEVAVPQNGPTNAFTYAAVWIPRLSSMLVIGGQINGASPSGLYVYTPSTRGWSTQPTTGSFNYGRTAHCAASNADGSLVAVFGGFVGGAADTNVYILNTITWSWTSVPYTGRGRAHAACALVDESFIVWGGFQDAGGYNSVTPSVAEATLVFCTSTLTWRDTYVPSAALAGSGTNGGAGGNNNAGGGPGNGSGNGDNGGKGVDSGNGTGSNTGGSGGLSSAEIGGIAAGAAFVLAAVAFALYRSRRGKRISEKDKMASMTAAETANVDDHGFPDKRPPVQPQTPYNNNNNHHHHQNQPYQYPQHQQQQQYQHQGVNPPQNPAEYYYPTEGQYYHPDTPSSVASTLRPSTLYATPPHEHQSLHAYATPVCTSYTPSYPQPPPLSSTTVSSGLGGNAYHDQHGPLRPTAGPQAIKRVSNPQGGRGFGSDDSPPLPGPHAIFP
ncbi:hypothetical protein BGZ94_000248 [Podila epigama]|nr:hypothetical protein BGZ94_000248 [Podila epigama]